MLTRCGHVFDINLDGDFFWFVMTQLDKGLMIPDESFYWIVAVVPLVGSFLLADGKRY